MVIGMLLAHLVGDFILQWDRLARWKSEAFNGVLVHGFVVLLVTWLFSLPFDPGWWPWALFIGLTHFVVDAVQQLWTTPARRRLQTLGRFLLDQSFHLAIILIALIGSGYLPQGDPLGGLQSALSGNRILAFVLGYAFISMPTWILVEFIVYGLIRDSAPNFSKATNKYVGVIERWLIATFVILGQFILVPLVALPRLVLDRPQVPARRDMAVFAAELLTSVALAIAVGLGLRQLA